MGSQQCNTLRHFKGYSERWKRGGLFCTFNWSAWHSLAVQLIGGVDIKVASQTTISLYVYVPRYIWIIRSWLSFRFSLTSIQAVLVNNAININKPNDHLSYQIIWTHKKRLRHMCDLGQTYKCGKGSANSVNGILSLASG